MFIIASLVAYSSYKVYVDLYHEKGITEANINDIVIMQSFIRRFASSRKLKGLSTRNISDIILIIRDMSAKLTYSLPQKISRISGLSI